MYDGARSSWLARTGSRMKAKNGNANATINAPTTSFAPARPPMRAESSVSNAAAPSASGTTVGSKKRLLRCVASIQPAHITSVTANACTGHALTAARARMLSPIKVATPTKGSTLHSANHGSRVDGAAPNP